MFRLGFAILLCFLGLVNAYAQEEMVIHKDQTPRKSKKEAFSSKSRKKMLKTDDGFTSEAKKSFELSDGFTQKVSKKKRKDLNAGYFSSEDHGSSVAKEEDAFAHSGKGKDPRPWYKRGNKLNLRLLFKKKQVNSKDKKSDPNDSFTRSKQSERKMRHKQAKTTHERGLFQKGVLPNK